jgi:hypothetical protein
VFLQVFGPVSHKKYLEVRPKWHPLKQKVRFFQILGLGGGPVAPGAVSKCHGHVDVVVADDICLAVGLTADRAMQQSLFVAIVSAC